MRRLFPLLSLLSVLACKPSAPSIPVATSTPAGPALVEVAVTAKGFEPPRAQVPAGRPVVLRITRKVAETCADAVDVQGDPVRHMLPLDRPVDIRVTAPASGEIAFACPMKMIHGALVVAQ